MSANVPAPTKYVFRKKRYLAAARAFDAVGSVLFRPFRRTTKRIPDSDVREILLVRGDHLGDAIGATGVPKALKQTFPSARVRVLTSSWSAPLFEHNPFVDEVILFDPRWFSRGRYRQSREALGFFATVSRLRKRKIDLGLGLRGDVRENMLLWLAGVRQRVGYGITGGGFLLTRELPYRAAVHESEHTLDILRFLGMDLDRLPAQIHFSDKERDERDTRLASLGFRGAGPWLGVQLGAGSPSKEWPEDKMRDFLKLCASHLDGWRIVLTGTDAERFRWVTELAASGKGDKFVNLIGRTTLRDFLWLCRRLDAFVGADTGPAHAAAWLGAPTLFLYSGTNRFDQWKCLAENAFFLKKDVPCSPCSLERCVVEGHPCMNGMTPEEVLDKLKTEVMRTAPRRIP